MFFCTWDTLQRIVTVGICAYVALVVLLRVYGKRSLSQFNAFDFVVTVALGSTLATIVLSKSTALLEGITGIALLLSMQLALTWFAVRVPWVNRLVKSDPRLLYFRGRFIAETLKAERVTEGEIRSAVRQQGIASMAGVEAVVLETTGNISVVGACKDEPTALEGVKGYPPP